MSDKKVEAMKQGPLSQLDKVETAAKVRCARDFGVSTECALDMEDEMPVPQENLQAAMAECKALGLASNTETWQTFKRSVLGRDVANARLKPEQLARLRRHLEIRDQVGESGEDGLAKAGRRLSRGADPSTSSNSSNEKTP